MKFNKKSSKKITLLGALLVSGSCMAAQGDIEALASESTVLGTRLSALALVPHNPREYCAFDVGFSGTVLQTTASLIRSQRMVPAKENLEFALRTLERVNKNSQDCAYFSYRVSPYIKKTMRLIDRLVSLPSFSTPTHH